jgi:hypothetical protein
MAQPLITILELVRRCSPFNEERLALWVRRARHWATLGMLPVAMPGQGERSRRLYDPDTVYLLSALLRISDFGVETSILAIVSSFIQTNIKGRGGFARFWREAKRKGGSAFEQYIVIRLPPETYPLPRITWYHQTSGAVKLTIDLDPAIFLNLTRVFEEVRITATDEWARS